MMFEHMQQAIHFSLVEVHIFFKIRISFIYLFFFQILRLWVTRKVNIGQSETTAS